MKLSLGASKATFVKRVITRVITCSMLLVLPSCGIPDLLQAESGPTLPSHFHAVSDSGPPCSESSAHLKIDEFFSDSTLTSMIAQALASNQELKVLDQEIEVAKNEILARRGAYLPFVNFQAGAGLRKSSLYTPEGAVEEQIEYLPGKHFPEPVPDFLGRLNVVWALDIWRELRNARDAAEQRHLEAIEKRNFFVTRLVAEIAENYYDLMALDKRIEILNQTIGLQEESLKVANSNKAAARGTELAVQRFQAEVYKNQSEKLIVQQEIVEVENRVNLLIGRYPQPVERISADFVNLNLHPLSVGLPCQLLQNRPDIREAERELVATGLDVKVARAHFYPRVDLMAGIGYQAFNPRYLFNTPEAMVYNAAGDLVAPMINKKAIRAEYLSANAKQLERVYNYQRVVLNAYTEVVNRMSKAENYRKSIEIKRHQLESLEASVDVAGKLFQNARAEYVEVLLAQRDLMEARMVVVQTKKQQLSAIVNAYQALGGGDLLYDRTQDRYLCAIEPKCLPESEQFTHPKEMGVDELSRQAEAKSRLAPRIDKSDNRSAYNQSVAKR